MKKKHFRGKIKDGEVILEDPERYFEFIKELDGEEVFIDMGKWYQRRTGAQNRYYWGVIIDILSKETGYTREETHKALKQKFLPDKEILGQDIKDSTTNLSTVDFEEYMKEIRQWASRDLNCVIPQPNEAPGGFAYNPTQSML